MIVVNGNKRGRPGTWILDGVNPESGKRQWWSFRTRAEAEAERDRMGPRRRQAHDRPTLPINLTVSELAELFLKEVEVVHQDKPRTAESYASNLKTHVLPRIGQLKVRSVTREDVKDLLLRMLEGDEAKKRKSKGTVRLVLAVVRALLGHAKEAHIISVNPAGDRLGKKLQLFDGKRATQESTKKMALEAEELARLLETARASEDEYIRRLHPLFLLMARTGLRIGEALGLRWEDLKRETKQAYVVHSISRGRHGTTKSKVGRTIDLSPQVLEMLSTLYSARQVEQLERGWKEAPQIFLSTTGTPYGSSRVAKAFKELLREAELPARHSLKSLRHSYASMLIAAGVSPAYVQQQLGHASIELTLKVYGGWLPFKGGAAAVALLDGDVPAEKSESVDQR